MKLIWCNFPFLVNWDVKESPKNELSSLNLLIQSELCTPFPRYLIGDCTCLGGKVAARLELLEEG